jgi:hypothetical protein
VLVAFYYGVTGLASTWAFRKVLFTSARLFIFAGLLPFVGGIVLLAIAGYVVYLDVASAVPILVTMGLGVPLLALAAGTSRSGFFREKTVSYIIVDGKLTAAPAGPIS